MKQNMESRLDEITQEVMEIKKSLMAKPTDNRKTSEAWLDLEKAGKLASKKWKGLSVVEEIKQQRTK